MKRFPITRLVRPETLRRWLYRLQYDALVVVAAALGLLGVDRASALMGRAWRMFAPLNARHARADGHLAAAFPDLTSAERRRILGDMWENLGRTAAETILLPRLVADPDRFRSLVPPGGFEPARGGAIFVSLHTGNWEVAVQPLVADGFDVHAVYKPLRNASVEEWLAARRRPIYSGSLIPYVGHIALKLRSIARSGGTLCVLGDLNDPHGMRVPFFGRPASANPFPAMLARRLDLPLFVGRVVRRDGAHFDLEGHWLDLVRTEDAAADDLANTAAIHAQFEAWIREHPAQWMWAHRKWL